MLRRKFRKEMSNKDRALGKHNTDFVLDNFLERDMKTIVLPLYVAQHVTLAPKYSIRYDFITSNSSRFNTCVSLCATAIFAVWFYCAIGYMKKIELRDGTAILALTMLLYSVSLSTAFIFNSTITTQKSNMNAYLIILIQRIQKHYKFTTFDKRSITIVNWLYLTATIVFNVILFSCRLASGDGYLILKISMHLIFLSLDSNIIISVRTINLLRKCIEIWIAELEYFCYANSPDGTGADHVQAKNYNMKKMIVAYDELIEALTACNRVCGPPILLMMVTAFFQMFANVQATILATVWNPYTITSQIIWMKNIIMITLLGAECENVHLKLKNAHIVCILLSTRERSKDLSCLLRKQRQQADIARDGGWLSAGGLFPLRAVLPLKFLSELASYIIVILQFNFL